MSDLETNDQIAAVMLQHGTPAQQAEALLYARARKGALCATCAGKGEIVGQREHWPSDDPAPEPITEICPACAKSTPAINFEREFHIAIKKHLNRRQQGFVMGEFRRVLALAGVM